MHGEHSISRVLYRLHGDDYLSSHPIAWMIKRRNPEGQRAASTLPYSVLLQMGFTKPAGLPTAGALLPHLSTLTTCVAVSFSMALSLGSPPPDVIRHPALRRLTARNHLSCSQGTVYHGEMRIVNEKVNRKAASPCGAGGYGRLTAAGYVRFAQGATALKG